MESQNDELLVREIVRLNDEFHKQYSGLEPNRNPQKRGTKR